MKTGVFQKIILSKQSGFLQDCYYAGEKIRINKVK